MDAAAYVQFLERLGHRVIPTATMHWYDVDRRFYLSAPPHCEFEPVESELREVMRGWRCFGVRYATPLHGRGKLSYQITCDNRHYRLEALSANVRSKVRRGLKRCEVGAVPLTTLATAGRQAHTDTVARQGRTSGIDGAAWERFWAAAEETEGFEGWGAWTGDRLVAFLVSVTFNDSVEFLLARSCSDDLGAYPNNALIYHVTEEMLVRRGVREITFGLESLEPVGPLDQFKFGMGFRARPLRQRIVFQPLLSALLRQKPVRAMVRRWSHRQSPEAVFWRKAEGLLRFAEEGGF